MTKNRKRSEKFRKAGGEKSTNKEKEDEEYVEGEVMFRGDRTRRDPTSDGYSKDEDIGKYLGVD